MELRLHSERGTYQKTYLAFLDILGFKNVLHLKCRKNPNYLLRLFSEADSAAHRDEFYGVKKLILSDSVLMWTQHKSAIPFLIENCECLQEQLFKKGHLVRGVIVKGDHYCGDLESFNTRLKKRLSFPDNIIVSPALVKAYLMEQSLREPVIKVEGAVLNDQLKISKKSEKSRRKHYGNKKFYYGRDYLGRFYYLLELVKCENKGWARELKKEFRAVTKMRDMVDKNLRRTHGSAHDKWKYVAKIFNRYLALLKKKSVDKTLFIPKIKIG